MPKIKVRTPDDGSEWPDDRLAILKTASMMVDGSPYPVVDAERDSKPGALLTIDTGDDGPTHSPGDKVDAGIVE